MADSVDKIRIIFVVKERQSCNFEGTNGDNMPTVNNNKNMTF